MHRLRDDRAPLRRRWVVLFSRYQHSGPTYLRNRKRHGCRGLGCRLVWEFQPQHREYLGPSGDLSADIIESKQTMAACNVNSLFSNIGETTALLGLGWQNLAATNATPFVQQLWEAGLLNNPVFGLGFADTSFNAAGKTLVSGG